MGNTTIIEPTILYVDDQASHLALFQKAFRGDYLVLTASSGEEGLQILREHDVFLVVADHNMPRMTGIDFLEQAKQVSPKAVQAIVSAYLNDEILQDAKKRTQAIGHLKKPWKLDGMRRFVEEAQYRYAHGPVLPTTSNESVPPPSIRRIPFSWGQVAQSLEGLGGIHDPHGIRRIFLNHVEPRLKEYVAVIKRPMPALLRAAQEEALRGNFFGMEQMLTAYLIESLQNEEETPHQRIVN